mgnify:CR=1 FL=1
MDYAVYPCYYIDMIIITGASDGLGLELAKIYKEAGKKVINVSRRKSDYADENLLTDLLVETEIKRSVLNQNDTTPVSNLLFFPFLIK